jgi:hypothetical protein
MYTAVGICHTGYADCLLADSQHNLYVGRPIAVYTLLDS